MFRPMRRMERRRMMAVVGTAAVVGHHSAERQEAEMQQQAAQQQEAAAPQEAPPQEAAPAPTAAPAAEGGSDITAQLEQLSQLHNAGVLSDQEFEEAKQKALAGG